MKKSEIYLLFFMLTLFVTLLIVLVTYFTKPSMSNITLVEDEDYTKLQNTEQVKLENDWISKVSQQNKDFTYPTIIYHMKF